MLLLVFYAMTEAKSTNYRPRMQLAGAWQFALDPANNLSAASPFYDNVTLPGTTDTNRKGVKNTKTDETTHLTRLYSYVGKAWYRRSIDIPKKWENKEIYLHLERTKTTTVFVDDKKVGSCNDISTPQSYNLTKFVSPGKHALTILVDNNSGVPTQLYANSHAFSEDTQTNWNGIIGDMYIEAVNPTHISDIQISTDSLVHVRVAVTSNNPKRKRKVTITASRIEQGSCRLITRYNIGDYVPTCDGDSLNVRFYMGNIPWSEFHPTLYNLTVEVEGCDEVTKKFGFIDFKAKDHHFYVNGYKMFLRGKHDACVFPLTGHVPMNTASWVKYFTTLKDYGINHVRFHSWCPPEAAFKVADEMGFYLQPELPFWGDFNDKDSVLMSYLMKEGKNILRAYGNHPSFVMMALGNELWGSVDEMRYFTDVFRTVRDDKLYTLGSNYYLGYKGYTPGMDYLTTCRIGGEEYGEYNTHTRGTFSFADAADGGLINHMCPNTHTNFENAIRDCPVPVISHETGQFQSYPDYDEIGKYHGVLYPYNLETFRSRLVKARMGDQAKVFHDASGRWAVELYKADIEMDLRTANMAGFQLLDIQDYPGQGSAYVGVLDAFMESKHITTPEEFRQWCAPVVPLLLTPTYCFTAGDTVSLGVRIANYGEQSLREKELKWSVNDLSGHAYKSGILYISRDVTGLFNVGMIRLRIPESTPKRYNLTLSIDGTPYKNAYPMWFYPKEESVDALGEGIVVTRKMTDEIGKKLTEGAKVLLMPDSTQFAGNTVGGLFMTDYWNYRMFKTISENAHKPVSPGTLGILTDPYHPIFNSFPTESHTNWQWYPIIKGSTPLILDSLPADYRPIVQVIDNVERNHKLGLIFEFAVGNGKLLVCMNDLLEQPRYIESTALYASIIRYMKSDDFNPGMNIGLKSLMDMLSAPPNGNEMERLENISYH